MNRTRWCLVAVIAAAVVSACGSENAIVALTDSSAVAAPRTTDGTMPEVSTPISGSVSDPGAPSALPVETIDVDCGPSAPGSDRALVTAQEFVFDGTVTSIVAERNPEAEFRVQYLDDGHENPGGPVPDEATLSDPETGSMWPWTTFSVNAWFTSDWGTEITIWTAGLDLAVGDRMLVAGEAFTTMIPEVLPHSGMAVVCTSTAHTQQLAGRWSEWFVGSVMPGGDQPEGVADQASIDAIEAGRALWNENVPEVYSATIDLFGTDTPQSSECLGSGGPWRIVVEKGSVVSVTDTGAGCRIDPTVSPVVTIDDLFDIAITAQAAASGRSFEIDPTWGYPTSFQGSDRSVEISGGVSWFVPEATTTLSGAELDSGLAAQRATWASSGLSSYTFVLDRLCFCEQISDLVTVIEGQPSSVTVVDGTAIGSDETAQVPNSMDSLFDWIGARLADSDLVVATFASADGHPLDIQVDAFLNGNDDELTYRVHDLAAL